MPRKATIPSSAKPTVKPKKSPVKTTPVQKTLPAVEKVVPIDTPVSPRPRPSAAELSNLARRVMQRQQETAAPGNRVDGFGKPIEAPPTAVEITVKYSDGTVTSAVGKEQVTDVPRMVQVGGNQTQAEPGALLDK